MNIVFKNSFGLSLWAWASENIPRKGDFIIKDERMYEVAGVCWMNSTNVEIIVSPKNNI